MATRKNTNNENRNYGRAKNESARSLPPTQKKPPMPKVKPPAQKKSK